MFIILIIILLICILINYTKENFTSSNMELTLWCEGIPKSVEPNIYAQKLVSFINKANITRIILRIENPTTSPFYNWTSSSCADDECCINKCGNANSWCEKDVKFCFCNGKSTKQYPCGISSFTIKDLLQMLPQIEIHALPWLADTQECGGTPDGVSWGYIPELYESIISESDWNNIQCQQTGNLEKSIIYIKAINNAIGSNKISGFCLETEGANPWNNISLGNKILPQLRTKYNMLYLKLSTASLFSEDTSSNFDMIFPQFYNLNILNKIDVVADCSQPQGNYMFPDTMYSKLGPQDLATAFAQISKPKSNNSNTHYMFSLEVSKPQVRPHCANNIYYPPNSNSIFGTIDDSAYINAFGVRNPDGSPIWTWERFTQFLTEFGKIYNTNKFAIFQFNFIPELWLS